MEIGPRNAEEEKLNEIFEAACEAIRETIPKGVKVLLVMRRQDGVFINVQGGCIHTGIEIAQCAIVKLAEMSGGNDCEVARN